MAELRIKIHSRLFRTEKGQIITIFTEIIGFISYVDNINFRDFTIRLLILTLQIVQFV